MGKDLIKLIYVSFFCQITIYNVSAQEIRSKTSREPDSLQLAIAYSHSTFAYHSIVDSCFNVHDSACISANILKVDPYLFIFKGIDVNSIDSFLSHRYNLPRKVKKKYIDSFTKIYNAPRSVAYNTFKMMADEDQAVRSGLGTTRMRETDSVHSDYLHKYITTKGWPSLSDGAMYATIIALHNSSHFDEYIPIIKKGILAGKTDMSVLKLVLWKKNWYVRFDDAFKEALLKKKYMAVDASCMLKNNALPDSVVIKIIRYVRDYCPVRMKYIFRHNTYRASRDWLDKFFYALPHRISVFCKLSQTLAEYNCKLSVNELNMWRDCWWSIKSDSTDIDTPQLILYIYHSRDIAPTTSFNEILEKKKFVTRSIHFEINTYNIKPESIGFIRQLSDWLQQNPLVKLQIDGHTDLNGDSLANIKLSQSRANEVKKQLVAMGVDSIRLTTKGLGATKPIQSNTTEQGKAENRRVEFILQE